MYYSSLWYSTIVRSYCRLYFQSVFCLGGQDLLFSCPLSQLEGSAQYFLLKNIHEAGLALSDFVTHSDFHKETVKLYLIFVLARDCKTNSDLNFVSECVYELIICSFPSLDTFLDVYEEIARWTSVKMYNIHCIELVHLRTLFCYSGATGYLFVPAKWWTVWALKDSCGSDFFHLLWFAVGEKWSCLYKAAAFFGRKSA